MDELIQRLNKYDGFAKYIGIEIIEAANGAAKARIELEKHHGNPIGSVHGGCLFSLADTVAGVALSTTGVGCTTLSSHVVYLKAAMMDKSRILYASAKAERIGHKIAVYDVFITDDTGLDIAKMTIEYFILPDMYKKIKEDLTGLK